MHLWLFNGECKMTCTYASKRCRRMNQTGTRNNWSLCLSDELETTPFPVLRTSLLLAFIGFSGNYELMIICFCFFGMACNKSHKWMFLQRFPRLQWHNIHQDMVTTTLEMWVARCCCCTLKKPPHSYSVTGFSPNVYAQKVTKQMTGYHGHLRKILGSSCNNPSVLNDQLEKSRRKC